MAHSITVEARKVPVGTKLAHGVGTMAFAAKDAAYVNFVPFFYTQVAGLSGTLYGWAAFVGQLSDALTDPIFGTLSDNTRSRWGRRHPYMVASILPLTVCFYLLFHPPAGWSGAWLFLWLAAVSVALRTALTAFNIPHTALGSELSGDYEERALVASYRTLFGWIAGVVIPALALTLVFSRGEGGGDGRLLASNYSVYAWISIAVVITAIAWTAFFTRREIPRLPRGKAPRKLGLMDPVRDVASAIRNRNFRFVFVSLIFMGTSTGVAVTLGYYANTYFWEFSAAQVGLVIASSVVGVGAAFALLRSLLRRFEKKQIFFGAMLVMVANGCWWIGARLVDLLPANGDPILFRLAIVHQIVLAGAVMLVQTIGASMVADVVDEHEVETGERSDGVFFAAMGFAMKIPTGLGQLVGGILIDVVGIRSGLEPGEVPADVLWSLGLVAGPLTALSFLVPLLVLLPYDLDRARHAALRTVSAAPAGIGS